MNRDSYLPDIVQFRVSTYSQRLRVRSHGIQLPMGVKFGAAYRLHVLQSGDGNETRSPAAVAASIASFEFWSRFLLQNEMCDRYFGINK